ncbi:MAG: phenylalanine--tRNA ligase subunit alpha [Nitrospinota bacterium]
MNEYELKQHILGAAKALRDAMVTDADLREKKVEEVRLHYLGRKGGVVTEVMRNLKNLSTEEKRAVGPLANCLREFVEAGASAAKKDNIVGLIDAYRLVNNQVFDDEIKRIEEEFVKKIKSNQYASGPRLDLTLPGRRAPVGHKHPLIQTMEDIVEVLARLGYTVAEGPEAELDHYNFEALNIPRDHPARDMQDTFYIGPPQAAGRLETPENDVLLRTHTSPVQIRVMERQRPPVKVIAPGKVFRCDADVTHSPMFHQVEGLYVDRGVTFAHLKGTLETFVRELFGPEFKVRIRPSFFPFTEPSAEVDIASPFLAGGRWLEVLGAGMVDPAVFEAVNQARGNNDYDPEAWTGFAWGLGVERVAMLRYGIGDIRLFYENDLRFLRQF